MNCTAVFDDGSVGRTWDAPGLLSPAGLLPLAEFHSRVGSSLPLGRPDGLCHWQVLFVIVIEETPGCAGGLPEFDSSGSGSGYLRV